MPGLILDRPPAGPGAGVGVLLSHGAGGDASDAGLTALAQGLAGCGHTVARFNLPYREAGRSSPPAAEKSVPGYVEAYAAARAAAGDPRPWAVGGKSYGARVASMAVAGGMEAAALVFYGYPLHPPGKPEALRVAHWPSITVPCLFLEGTEDPFCTLGLLRQHLPSLGGPATLEVVQGGDHSLRVAGAKSLDGKPRGAAKVMADLAPMASGWLKSVVVRG